LIILRMNHVLGILRTTIISLNYLSAMTKF
jgi:hypothetical protein